MSAIVTRAEPAALNDRAPALAHHIVVVDDDARVRTLLTRILRECGYEVTGARDGTELKAIVGTGRIDLILLGIMLPGESGIALCQMIRALCRVPIILIRARGHQRDRVAGLDVGADDYIAKPFGRSEVLARVRAVLRRMPNPHAPLDAPVPERFEFASWQYHARRRELIAPSGAEVDLTAAEQDLLLALLRHPQRMIGRERLLELSRSRIGSPTDRPGEQPAQPRFPQSGGQHLHANLYRSR